jgi:hypothetical protein
LIEILPNIFGKEAEDQIAVLLKQGIFAAISPVSVRAPKVLAAIQLDGDS